MKSRAEDAEESRVKKSRLRLKSIVSGATAVTGLGLLAYHHFDAVFTIDNVGCSLVAIGILSSLVSSNHPIAQRFMSKKGEPPKFSFKLINYSNLFSTERTLLEQTVPIKDIASWPPDIQKKLESYRNRDAKRVKSEISARNEAMGALINRPDDTPYTSERDALSALAPRAFVLDYISPLPVGKAESGRRDHRSRADLLGEEVSLLIACASTSDVVIINLTSPGGSVIEYGLAASHLLRLKKAGIRTIVTVDKVAASGGFMMACCADEIVAAPFAYLGSIGVVAELPNFHKVLNKNEVDYFMFTAGNFKRTVSLFNEVTVDGKKKFQEQLEGIHTAFKEHVSEQRGNMIDVDKVATGEAWLALQCKEYGLVDRLGTSWDVIKEMSDSGYDVIKIERKTRKLSLMTNLRESASDFSDISHALGNAIHQLALHLSPTGILKEGPSLSSDQGNIHNRVQLVNSDPVIKSKL